MARDVTVSKFAPELLDPGYLSGTGADATFTRIKRSRRHRARPVRYTSEVPRAHLFSLAKTKVPIRTFRDCALICECVTGTVVAVLS
ncbi:unnamed protein product [Leptosia nina]|uniref:Uncharacterized protein n=1 Tax=Leptosia nina TaxID=320188 RepID=A0AAV1IUJ9_9NEOP